MKLLPELLEKLENNSSAVESVDCRIENVRTSPFYSMFGHEYDRNKKIVQLKKLKNRVLKMRFTLLERIHALTIKEMKRTSNEEFKLTA